MFLRIEKLTLENREFAVDVIAPLSTTGRCGRGNFLKVNGLSFILGEFLFLGGTPKMFESPQDL